MQTMTGNEAAPQLVTGERRGIGIDDKSDFHLQYTSFFFKMQASRHSESAQIYLSGTLASFSDARVELEWRWGIGA